MKNSTKFLTLAAIGLLISSCTSLEEKFQNMSHQDRAEYICSRDRDVSLNRADKNRNENSVNKLNRIISRGYRIHNDCNKITVEYGTATCTTNTYGDNSTTKCTRPTKKETVCVESPVPIDYENERAKMAGFTKSMLAASEKYDRLYKKCYLQVEPLNSESAYNFFYNKS